MANKEVTEDGLSEHQLIHQYFSYRGKLDSRRKTLENFRTDGEEIPVKKIFNLNNEVQNLESKINDFAVSLQKYYPLNENESLEDWQNRIEPEIKKIEKGNKNQKQNKVEIGRADNFLIHFEQKFGFNLEGYSHTVTDDFKNHVVSHHGDKNVESHRHQVPISKSDLSDDMLSNIVNYPDFIVGGLVTSDKKSNSIIFAKNIGSTTVLVEEILSEKRKELRAKTFWKNDKILTQDEFIESLMKNANYDFSKAEIADIKKLTSRVVSQLHVYQQNVGEGGKVPQPTGSKVVNSTINNIQENAASVNENNFHFYTLQSGEEITSIPEEKLILSLTATLRAEKEYCSNEEIKSLEESYKKLFKEGSEIHKGEAFYEAAKDFDKISREFTAKHWNQETQIFEKSADRLSQNQTSELSEEKTAVQKESAPEKTEQTEQAKNATATKEKPQDIFDGTKPIVYGETVLPAFAVMADGKLHSVENAIISSYNKQNQTYIVSNGDEKLELPKKTLETLLQDKQEREQEQIKKAEGRTIVFEDKERGVKGTVLPEFSMITQNGLKTFKDCVVQSFNPAENTYTLSNGDTTLSVTADRFKEITSEERFNQKFDENTKSYEKLLTTQYNDYFKQRDNTAYNFRHNLAVYCRKEANSPCDALHLAKEIINRMPKDEQKKTQNLLKKLTHENETVNEMIVRTYHEAIKEVPLNEDYIKQNQPKNVVVRPFYDTISDSGKKIENDPALIKGNSDRNLKVGDTIKNINFSMKKVAGIGKENVHFDELKVVSASKEGNTITLMDGNKSFYKLPRDTVLDFYKEQQQKEMKQEQRHQRSNSISMSYV